MAVTVQTPGVEWGKWHQHRPQYNQPVFYEMGMPNAVRPQGYDSRTSPTDGLARFNGSWYSTGADYAQTPQINPAGQPYQEQYSYVSTPDAGLLSNSMIANVPCNYIQTQSQSQPQPLSPASNQPLPRYNVSDISPGGRLHNAVKHEQHFADVKSEAHGPSYNNHLWTTGPIPTAYSKEPPVANNPGETTRTDVDKLMKAIQTRPQSSVPSRQSSPARGRTVVGHFAVPCPHV